MPECVDCGVMAATVEMRRTTRNRISGLFTCRNRPACTARRKQRQADLRSAALRPEELGRIARSFDQLDRLRTRLRGAWDGEALADVRVAHEALSRYINNGQEG